MQNERIQWLMAGLNHTRPEAQELAAQELLNFNQPDGELLDEQDPLGTLDQVKAEFYSNIILKYSNFRDIVLTYPFFSYFKK